MRLTFPSYLPTYLVLSLLARLHTHNLPPARPTRACCYSIVTSSILPRLSRLGPGAVETHTLKHTHTHSHTHPRPRPHIRAEGHTEAEAARAPAGDRLRGEGKKKSHRPSSVPFPINPITHPTNGRTFLALPTYWSLSSWMGCEAVRLSLFHSFVDPLLLISNMSPRQSSEPPYRS